MLPPAVSTPPVTVRLAELVIEPVTPRLYPLSIVSAPVAFSVPVVKFPDITTAPVTDRLDELPVPVITRTPFDAAGIVTRSLDPGATLAGVCDCVTSAQFAGRSQLPATGPIQANWSTVPVPAGGVPVSPVPRMA